MNELTVVDKSTDESARPGQRQLADYKTGLTTWRWMNSSAGTLKSRG